MAHTEFSLVARKVKTTEQFDELTEELYKRDLIHYAFCEGIYDELHKEAVFSSYDYVRWSGNAKDMVHISEKFPKMYFELTGIGDGYDDFWKEYWHDGEVEFCRGEVVYEQPKKMQWQELIAF